MYTLSSRLSLVLQMTSSLQSPRMSAQRQGVDFVELLDAQPSATLLAARKEFDQACGSDWTPLGLSVPHRLGKLQFRQMATLEIRPGELLVKNGFPFPKPGSTMVTQDDFPAVIAVIARAADAELGAGAALAVARPNETSRSQE